MIGYLSNFGDGLFDDFERLQRQMDQVLGGWSVPAGIRAAARGSYPAINVGATPERVDIYAFAPGLDRASLNVAVQQNLLTLSGERKRVREKEARYYLDELFAGAFHRVIALPEDVDPSRVEAKYQDGILHVMVQRREEVRPRQIEVK